MAHYVISLGDTALTVSAWSEDDAKQEFYDKADLTWDGYVGDIHVDSIRPATVREAMVSEYGEDWQKHGPNHVFEIVNTYRTEYKDVMTINGTGANDVHGHDDAVSVANYRVLQDRWSDLEGLSRGPWSNIDVVALELDSEAPADLTEVLDGLADYPCVDEEEVSRVEQEMILEHWDSYGKRDLVREVEKATGIDTLSDAGEEIVTQLVWDGILDYGCGSGYPTMIDASACDFGEKEIPAWFLEHLGTVVTVKSQNGYGDPVTFDLTLSNLEA